MEDYETQRLLEGEKYLGVLPATWTIGMTEKGENDPRRGPN